MGARNFWSYETSKLYAFIPKIEEDEENGDYIQLQYDDVLDYLKELLEKAGKNFYRSK